MGAGGNWIPLPIFNLMIWTVLLLTIASAVMASPHVQWEELETMPEHIQTMREVSWGERTAPSTPHTVVFHLTNPRQKEFQQLAESIADPRSPMYGKHLTKEQVDQMTRNDEGLRAVEEYLASVGATVGKRSADSIEASAPISVWEDALHAQFREATVPLLPGQVLHRATAVSLPQHLAQHVHFVSNTVQLPAQLRGGPILQRKLI